MITSASEIADALPPIGVFDSGLGGLSVLREIVGRLPGYPLIYVADSGYCPYGGKSPEQIIARATAITDFLISRGAQLIVVACNTATIAAVEYLRANYSLNFVGMEPAVKPAVARTRSRVVGVLATGAALAGEKLLRLIDRHAGNVRIITQPCPGWVEQVERGELDTPATREMVGRCVEPLIAAGADVLVLGCTHFSFLRPLIAEVAGAGVLLLETGEAVARRVASLLEQDARALPSAHADSIEWFTSGAPESMQQVGSRLWGDALAAARLEV